MAKYHGKNGLVYVSPSGTGVAVSVGGLSEWSLDMAVDTVEVTAFGDTNKTYVVGLKDLKGSFSGFWDDAVDTLFTATDSGEAVRMYLYPNSTAITKYWYGTAFTDISVSTGVSAAVAVSGNFTAASAWGRK
ncbi:MAG: hypothetical protein WC565_05615 [Parcubacteria group bacterium]